MKEKLTHNLGLKILAVFVAALLWLISININDPISQRTYTVSVQLLNLSEMTDSGKYVEILDSTDTVRVTVRASRSVFSNFSERNLVATADVKEITEDNRIPIEINTSKTEDKIESIKGDKEFVEINIEDITKVQKPISVAVQNEPAEGYMLRSTGTEQNAVIISGPESVVSKVASAKVEINVEGATSDVNISLPLRLYDNDGIEIEDSRLSKSVTSVSTTATILQLKTIPVYFAVTGEAAEGYVYSGDVLTAPDAVTIAGKPSALKNVEYIEIKDVLDIDGATENVPATVDVSEYLPEGVIMANASASTVTAVATVEKEEKRTIEMDSSKITLRNVPDGSDISLRGLDDKVEVQLAGKGSVLETITEADITAYVDIQALMQAEDTTELAPGHYYPNVVLELPDYVRVTENLKVHIFVE